MKTKNDTISRRDLLKLGAHYGVGAATLALMVGAGAGIPALARAAASESEKRQNAEHTLVLGVDGVLDKFPDRRGTVDSSWINGTRRFKESVESLSNGRIYVNVQDGGALGSQTAGLKKVQQGIIQGASCSTQNAAQLAPVWNVIDVPYVIGSDENAWRLIFSKEFNDSVRKASEQRHLTLAWSNPVKRWLEMSVAAKRKVYLPEDLAGMKMRVTGSRMEQAAIGILPCSATPVAWAETYSALKDGAVDGIHISVASVHDGGMTPVIGQIVNTGWMYSFDSIFLNTAWIRSLDDDLQEAVMQSCFEAQKKAYDDYDEVMKYAIGVRPDSPDTAGWASTDTEITFLDETQMQAWRDYLSPTRNASVFNTLIDQFGRREYEAVQEILADAGEVKIEPWWR